MRLTKDDLWIAANVAAFSLVMGAAILALLFG